MNDRIKIQVQTVQGRWKTAYSTPAKSAGNVKALEAAGLKVRVGGIKNEASVSKP
jgi:hypothetical protein